MNKKWPSTNTQLTRKYISLLKRDTARIIKPLGDTGFLVVGTFRQGPLGEKVLEEEVVAVGDTEAELYAVVEYGLRQGKTLKAGQIPD